MVKKYLIAVIFLAGANLLLAQDAPLKIGFVDSQVILAQLPEAIKAQGDLDALTNRWSIQLDSMTQAYQQLVADYQKQSNTMTEEKKLAAQKEVVEKEQQILNFRKDKFGQQTGEIYKKQEEIFGPVKTKIYKAIEDVAKGESMKFVFDKSGDIILLYADPNYDITYKVLDKLKRGT